MTNSYTFNSSTRYMTRGVSDSIPLEIQIIIWSKVDDLVKSNITTDYLQVFTIEVGDKIIITHSQEQPEYKKTYEYAFKEAYGDLDNVKIYVIDDRTHSTMLLASEY